MKIILLHNSPLILIDKAIGKCWNKGEYLSINRKKGIDRIERVGLKNKHESVLEHVYYTFDIDGISRACLQELARHRIASISVKSTRYTLKELKIVDDVSDFLVMTDNEIIDKMNEEQLKVLQHILNSDQLSNDVSKYSLPEAFKTSLIWTINVRSLRNFLQLRSSKSALSEIRELAYAIYHTLPSSHLFLYEDIMNEEK